MDLFFTGMKAITINSISDKPKFDGIFMKFTRNKKGYGKVKLDIWNLIFLANAFNLFLIAE